MSVPTTPTGDINLEQMGREYGWRLEIPSGHYSRLSFIEWFLDQCERDWPY